MGRDQTRYFTPAWGPRSKALKFVYFASIKDGEPHDRKGFVPVLPDSGVAAQDDMLCVVRPLVPALFPWTALLSCPALSWALNSLHPTPPSPVPFLLGAHCTEEQRPHVAAHRRYSR